MGARCSATSCSCARACRGSSGAGASSTTRCGSPTSCARSARSSSRAARPPTRARSRAARRRARARRSRSGSARASGGACTSSSSRRYTEKVWGVPTSEIRAEWAAQRIRTLSFWRVVRAALLNDGGDVHSLIEQFHYPRLGPGPDVGGDGGRDRRRRRRAAPRRRASTRLELARRARRGGARRRRARRGRARRSRRCRCATSSRSPTRRRRAAVLDAAHGPALPRLPHGRARRPRRRPLPRQLDLRPRPRRARRADPELPRLERGDGARRRAHVRRPGVLLLRGRRAVERDRRRARRARDARARRGSAWPTAGASRPATSCASRRPIRSTTPTTSGACGTSATWLEGIANLQQIGRNGLHRYNNSDHSMLTALRAVENACRGADARPVGGQLRRRVPRGARAAPSSPTAARPRRPRCALRRRARRAVGGQPTE